MFPGLQGGPLMHVIAAKAVAFGEALRKDFRRYQEQVLENARVMAKVLNERGLRIVSGGTDSHLFLVDLRAKKITGKDAEAALAKAHITVNKNSIPNDPEKPFVTSGHPPRQPGGHHARLHRARVRGARTPDRRRARSGGRRRQGRQGGDQRRGADQEVPGLRVAGNRGQASGISCRVSGIRYQRKADSKCIDPAVVGSRRSRGRQGSCRLRPLFRHGLSLIPDP